MQCWSVSAPRAPHLSHLHGLLVPNTYMAPTHGTADVRSLQSRTYGYGAILAERCEVHVLLATRLLALNCILHAGHPSH